MALDTSLPRTAEFKVGFAQREVRKILDYIDLPHHVTRDLRDVLAVLNAEQVEDQCTAYGAPTGRCVLPAAHEGPHRMGAER